MLNLHCVELSQVQVNGQGNRKCEKHTIVDNLEIKLDLLFDVITYIPYFLTSRRTL